MNRSLNMPFWLTLRVGIPFAFIGLVLISSWTYTNIQLHFASERGIFSSAEEGMRDFIAKNYVAPDKYQIIYAGTNSFDGSSPHVWYVIACVWGGHRLDGSSPGSERHAYDQPGIFFLNAKEGWVFMPEGAFPELLGFWMKVFNLAGPGSSQPTHDWGSSPQGDCVF